MCRWMAYSGDPILVEDLLFRPKHSLIDQSLHSRLGATTTNGDGFGIGWYGDGPVPALFKGVDPAWNDQNLREIAFTVRTPLFFAHVRASTGTPVQRTELSSVPPRALAVDAQRRAGEASTRPNASCWGAVARRCMPTSKAPPTRRRCSSWRSRSGLVDDPFAAVVSSGRVRGEGRPPATGSSIRCR